MTFPDILQNKDLMLLHTDTLIAWISRPTVHHRNWWLRYYSSDAVEACAWNEAIGTICKPFSPFHQSIHDIDHRSRHPGCLDRFLSQCPGVAHGWEMWLGCSEWALEFPDEPLKVISELGDPALDSLLAVVPEIRKFAEAWVERYR